MKKKSVNKKSKKNTFWCASCLDVAFTKWSVAFFTLFLVLLFPTFFFDLQDWKWAFLTISILLGIKPLRSFLKR